MHSADGEPRSGAIAVDAGALTLASGLLALVRPALLALRPEGVLAVLSRAASAGEDLPAFCRAERHRYLGAEPLADGQTRHLIARGAPSMPRPGTLTERPSALTTAAQLVASPMPERAMASTGFAPRGSAVEPGGPDYPFSLCERDRVAPPKIGQLYDQAVGGQWSAQELRWDEVRPLAPEVDAALGQVMSFLAENELSALYVPSRFLPRIHPAYAETAMVLAVQLADEARHIDVFLKRARLCGTLGVSTVTTARSLRSLLEPEDFTEATFLLSVLGEGTFLDLLRFIERFAPDATTADLVRRARADEARHVHFGVVHVRHALEREPGLFARLEAAVRRRAATLQDGGSVPGPIQDALTVLAAGSTDPKAIARGHDAFRELLQEMEIGRVKRLRSAGFDEEQARILAGLHTSNFM